MLCAKLIEKKGLLPILLLMGFSVPSLAAAEGVYVCRSSGSSPIEYAQLYLDTTGQWGELTYRVTGREAKLSLSGAGTYFHGSRNSVSALSYLYADSGGGYATLELTLGVTTYDLTLGCAAIP